MIECITSNLKKVNYKNHIRKVLKNKLKLLMNEDKYLYFDSDY
jgi:hypothetical protein